MSVFINLNTTKKIYLKIFNKFIQLFFKNLNQKLFTKNILKK